VNWNIADQRAIPGASTSYSAGGLLVYGFANGRLLPCVEIAIRLQTQPCSLVFSAPQPGSLFLGKDPSLIAFPVQLTTVAFSGETRQTCLVQPMDMVCGDAGTGLRKGPAHIAYGASARRAAARRGGAPCRFARGRMVGALCAPVEKGRPG
jgi:hypothetical protein